MGKCGMTVIGPQARSRDHSYYVLYHGQCSGKRCNADAESSIIPPNLAVDAITRNVCVITTYRLQCTLYVVIGIITVLASFAAHCRKMIKLKCKDGGKDARSG